jgi:hypothetical protein
MPSVISDASPLLYLYRIDGLTWLTTLFDEVWTAAAVVAELQEGQRLGFDVPNLSDYEWLQLASPMQIPAAWQTLDLGVGELAVMALALETPERLVLLDDALARQTAQVAGLTVWGTLRVLLEAKNQELISRVAPFVDQLRDSGMWISTEIQQRILRLAGES